ncbi:MAG: hypothetical protein ABJA35_00850 [Parafilimonas sp.]
MALDLNNLFIQLKTAVVNLAKEKFKDLVAEASSDGTSLLHILQDDIKKYSQELESNQITPDQFKILLLGDEDLVKMSALTEAGLAAAAADAFKKEVFDIIVNTVLAVI